MPRHNQGGRAGGNRQQQQHRPAPHRPPGPGAGGTGAQAREAAPPDEQAELITLADAPPTRDQQAMAGAYQAIGGLPADQELRAIYGGLCHQLPIWVRTNGLAQTLAFIREKGHPEEPTKARARAYRALERHIGAILGVAVAEDAAGRRNADALLSRVIDAKVPDYIGDTRTLLAAWVYYKRFAASVLGIENAQTTEVGDAAAD